MRAKAGSFLARGVSRPGRGVRSRGGFGAGAAGGTGNRLRIAMPEVMFAGPDGRLEGRYHHSKESGAPVALILHPHPLHGGTMNTRIT